MNRLRYLENVTTLRLDVEKCVGCGMCSIVCPHAVYEISNGKAAVIDRDACMECGACARNCPVRAISVRAGVGCAYGIIMGALRGTEPTCGCSAEGSDDSCC